MSNPIFAKGTLFKPNRKLSGGKEHIESLGDALSELAKCDSCGCDDCYGYTTLINAETGILMAKWITGPVGGPYVENIDTLENALPILKVLKQNR